MAKNVYKIKSKVVLYPGAVAAWHMIHIPKKEADAIKKSFGPKHRGWGSLPVLVTLRKTIWQTSIFWDNKSGTYILPLKAGVRKKERVYEGDEVKFLLEIKI